MHQRVQSNLQNSGFVEQPHYMPPSKHRAAGLFHPLCMRLRGGVGVALAIAGFRKCQIPLSPFHTMSTARATDGPAVSPSAGNVLEFLRIVGKLKTLKRTGWVNHGVKLPESVSDHMYRMAMCGFLITDPTIDRSRLMKLSIVHDLAESVVGDIVPHDVRYTKEQKRQMEEEALRLICADLGHAAIGEELVSLWLEYEDGSTPEALIVKDFDKFEMIVQADEYERAQDMRLDDFFRSTAGFFKHPQVVEWDRELRRQRDARMASDDGEGKKST